MNVHWERIIVALNTNAKTHKVVIVAILVLVYQINLLTHQQVNVIQLNVRQVILRLLENVKV